MKQVELSEQARQAKERLEARVQELKSYEGMTFIKRGSDGKTTFKVIRYEGIGSLPSGQKAHLFRVERFNPGLIYTPAATQFLLEHEETLVVPQTDLTNEII